MKSPIVEEKLRDMRMQVGLRVSAEERERLKKRAREERIPFSMWLRRAAFKELRRKSSV